MPGRKNSATPRRIVPEVETRAIRAREFHTCGGGMFRRLLSGITTNGIALTTMATGASNAVAPRSAAVASGTQNDSGEEQHRERCRLLEAGVGAVPRSMPPALGNPSRVLSAAAGRCEQRPAFRLKQGRQGRSIHQ